MKVAYNLDRPCRSGNTVGTKAILGIDVFRAFSGKENPAVHKPRLVKSDNAITIGIETYSVV